MRRRAGVFSSLAWLGMVWLVLSPQARAATPCPAAQASSAFTYLRPAIPGADEGVQPAGFVALASGQPTVDGIDVTRTKADVDFQAAYACGARFAYVQLSAGIAALDHSYRLYWPNALSAGLIAGPSHGLLLDAVGVVGWSSATAERRPALLQGLLASAPGAGAAQAALFLARLHEVVATEAPPAAGAPVELPPIVLDLTSDPLPTAAAADKAALGPVYAAEACAFLAAIRADAGTSQAPVMLFAEPRMWSAYRLAQNGCGLERLPVWIAYHALDGGRYDGPAAAPDLAVVEALCRPGGAADRCLMQQYSSAASFAVFKAGAHLDLDRWFGDPSVFNAALAAYR